MPEKISERNKFKLKKAALASRSWVVWLGRAGYSAMAVVHLLVGVLAALSVFGIAAAIGTRGAMRQMAELPFGQILLVAVAFGLVCHAFWRIAQALFDTDAKGADAKGFVLRGGFFLIALFYLGLAFSAARIVLGFKIKSGVWAQSWTAWLLAQPYGQWLVVLAALIAAGIGIFHFYQAFSAKFRETLQLAEMSEKQAKWGTRFGRFGFAARGIVFGIVGFFLLFAAVRSDAGETRSFGGALDVLEQQPYGAWLLAVVAAGLFSYGIFMIFLARFRRMVGD